MIYNKNHDLEKNAFNGVLPRKVTGILPPWTPRRYFVLGVPAAKETGTLAAETVMLKGLQADASFQFACPLIVKKAVFTACAGGLRQPISHGATSHSTGTIS